MINNILIWSCVIMFIATGIITLLGIINVVKIRDTYLKKLFYALILEIVSIGIIPFKDVAFGNTSEFIKITSPSDNFLYDKTLNSVIINGAFNTKYDIKGVIVVNNSEISLPIVKLDENSFSSNINSNQFENVKSIKAIINIVDGSEIIKSDSITILTN